MSSSGEPKILLDCDVVIHFLKGGKILELPTIFPGRFVMLDKVYNELLKRNSNALAIAVFLASTQVPVITMPTKPEAAYCQLNNIVYYTTMDLLHEATVKKIMTDAACNAFIQEVLSKGSRLPNITMAQYRKSKGL